jgi:4-amino-4-deoxy-L-arabinose transferase-like glycosyltransferase
MSQLHHRLAVLLSVAFVTLGVWQSLVFPIFEGGDEASHFRFAAYLADNRALPDLRDTAPSHQAAQPPLYHLWLALWIGPFDRSDLALHTQPNPRYLAQDPDATGPGLIRTLYLHPASQAWPFRGAVLAAQVGRWASLLLGLALLWAIRGLAVQIVRALQADARLTWLQADTAGVLVMALAALNPKIVHLSSVMANDVLVALCSTVCIWMLLRHPRPVSVAPALLIGVCAGLAMLSKLSGLALLPALLLWALRLPQPVRLQQGALAGAVAALIAGPWFGRNLWLYGDPLGASTVASLNSWAARTEPLSLTSAPVELYRLLLSYVDWFGFHFLFPPEILALLSVPLLVAIAAALVYGLTRPRLDRRAQVLLVLAWVATVLVLYAAWWVRYFGTANFRLLLPLLAPVNLTLVLGWLGIGRVLPVYRPVVRGLGIAVLLLLAAVAVATPAWFLPAGYAFTG